MPYQDFRQFLDALRRRGELIDIARPIALADVGKAIKQSYRRQGPGIMFNNNGTGFPLVAGVYSTRAKALLAFEADERTILPKVPAVDAAVDPAGVDAEIAIMIEKSVVPGGTTLSPGDYMLPRELGGLYR
ncbi:MAG TPA: hypothetical protein VKW08_16350 [Xanthobacteraceae bacterium]|nr:hypothetical protein [Xanthobacteraceae bacterium]